MASGPSQRAWLLYPMTSGDFWHCWVCDNRLRDSALLDFLLALVLLDRRLLVITETKLLTAYAPSSRLRLQEYFRAAGLTFPEPP